MVHNCPPVGQSQITKTGNDNPQSAVIEYLYNTPLPNGVEIPLATVSERDSVWDTHRTQSAIIEGIYKQASEFERYSERISDCSGYLKFGIGESGLVLKQAFFCRVRYCTTCQWRKGLYWKAMMYQSYEQFRKEYPKHRFLFLTLTVKNPPIGELRATLDHMNIAWKKLTKRKEFALVDGWIRTTEVTRPKLKRKRKSDPIVYCPQTKNTHAHPHFHIILMVKPSYFDGKNYLSTAKWAELWRDCLGVGYTPVVDVRAVRKKGKDKNAPITDDDIKAGIAETIKYSTKPDDIIHDHDDPQSREWFYELTRQTHKLRFVATGGALKNALKDNDPTNDDMIKTGNDDESQTTDSRRLNFTYYRTLSKYIYNPIHNE
jgi:plasmid rolling circle replication initiator protein Rep